MTFRGEKEWMPTGKMLGRGGQGEVLLVYDVNSAPDDLFALKTLRDDGIRPTQARDRFIREIAAIKSINHPNVIGVVDHSEDENPDLFYVMEYHKEARSLSEVISSPSLNPYFGNALTSLNLFEQIILALRECEKASPRIIHRDINPNNILVLPDNRICLIDFGICYFADGNKITLTDENVGTRNYTAPECEAGGEPLMGPHSDFYSAAKVLWAAICSKGAFSREEGAFSTSSLTNMFPGRPEIWHLTRIFERTIRKNIADRFHTTDMILALVNEVRYLIESGYSPLEEAGERCPLCGNKSFVDFGNQGNVFGHSVPRGIIIKKCDYCGFSFVRDRALWNQKIQERRTFS